MQWQDLKKQRIRTQEIVYYYATIAGFTERLISQLSYAQNPKLNENT